MHRPIWKIEEGIKIVEAILDELKNELYQAQADDLMSFVGEDKIREIAINLIRNGVVT